MNPTYDFNGQVAFVTGAAMGMGLAAPSRPVAYPWCWLTGTWH
jgi:hypothetical protein